MNLVEKFIEALRRNGVEILDEVPRGAYVSEAVSAAADTGVVFFAGFDEAKKSALAEHHVAIVRKDVIKENIVDAYIYAASKSKYIFASSSASKTADIEGKLVWGMHGPRKFSVVIR